MIVLRSLLACALAFLPLAEASAAVVQIQVKDQAGTTRTFNVTTNTDITGNLSWNNVICDQASGTTCATVTGSNALKVDGSAVTQPVGGTIASGSADAGNPIKMGGRYNSSAPTFTDGQRGDLQLTASGALITTFAPGTLNNNGIAAEGSSAPVVVSSGQAITGQNVASPTHFLNPCQFNTSPTTITSGNVSPFQCDNGGKLLVNPGTVTVTATNLSANVAQINGVTPLMGNGATGTGSPRATIANDNTGIGNWGHGAPGSAPPTNVVALGANASGATGGQTARLISCDLHIKYDASDNGSKEMIAAVSGRTVYICGFVLATGGTATNLKLVDGTGTDCATGTPVDLVPAYQLLANDRMGANAAFWNGLKATNTNRAVCVNASAGNAHQAEIWYTIL
jgi:hypothetical protein